MPRWEVTSVLESEYLLHGEKANRLTTERVQARNAQNAGALVKARKEKQAGQRVRLLTVTHVCVNPVNCDTCSYINKCDLVSTEDRLKKDLAAAGYL